MFFFFFNEFRRISLLTRDFFSFYFVQSHFVLFYKVIEEHHCKETIKTNYPEVPTVSLRFLYSFLISPLVQDFFIPSKEQKIKIKIKHFFKSKS